MPYPALAIANEFIKVARERNKQLTPMELLKLVYFAHGWYLALSGVPLINEPVQAWRFGPVIPSIYHAFKRYGSGPIIALATSDPFEPPIWGAQDSVALTSIPSTMVWTAMRMKLRNDSCERYGSSMDNLTQSSYRISLMKMIRHGQKQRNGIKLKESK